MGDLCPGSETSTALYPDHAKTTPWSLWDIRITRRSTISWNNVWWLKICKTWWQTHWKNGEWLLQGVLCTAKKTCIWRYTTPAAQQLAVAALHSRQCSTHSQWWSALCSFHASAEHPDPGYPRPIARARAISIYPRSTNASWVRGHPQTRNRACPSWIRRRTRDLAVLFASHLPSAKEELEDGSPNSLV